MVKIALILVGHYRSFDHNIESIIEQLRDVEYDCYFHTWNINEASTASWHSKGESKSIQLLKYQLETLREFDKNFEVETQVFEPKDYADTVYNKPWKAVEYLFNALQKCLKRILESDKKYDYIFVSRYDVRLKNLNLSQLQIIPGEIYIGGRAAKGYTGGVAASDVIFAFRQDDIPKLLTNDFLKDKHLFHSSEEPYSRLFYDKFTTVKHQWHWSRDFDIVR